MIVDTHTHASSVWMEPIETLRFQMDRCGVDHALLIQLRRDFDNSHILECSRREPAKYSAVVGIDIDSPAAPDVLADLVRQGAKAVRLDVDERSPGSDPHAIWDAAARLGIPVSVLGTAEQFASDGFRALVERQRTLPMVMEHLAGVGPYWGPAGGRADKAIPRALYDRILTLARYPNVYMKIPGFGEFTPRPGPTTRDPPFPTVEPLIEMAIDAFGASRLMWGSDFPPVAYREGYAAAFRLPRERVSFRAETDKDWIFGGTARAVFKLG